MNPNRLMAAVAVVCAPLAFAAPAAAPKPASAGYLTIDNSNATLMSAETAKPMWTQNLPAKLTKLYPVKKWGFVSEVDGGFDDAKTCVITARAMMVPRSGKSLMLPPAHTAIAFGTQAGATMQQCQDFAKTKLAEAIASVTSTLSR